MKQHIPDIGRVVVREGQENWLTQVLLVVGKDKDGDIAKPGVLMWGRDRKLWRPGDNWSGT